MMEKKVTTSKATTRAHPAILRWLADDAMVLGIHLDTKWLWPGGSRGCGGDHVRAVVRCRSLGLLTALFLDIHDSGSYDVTVQSARKFNINTAD